MTRNITATTENEIFTWFSISSNLSNPITVTEVIAAVNESDISEYPQFDILDLWELASSENLRHGNIVSVVLIITYLFIFFVGSIGNFLVILVILFQLPMQAVSNMFLINLAVADLLVTILCVPSTLIANLFRPWVLGSFMCKAVPFIQGVSVCASAYSLAALSLDRCIAIYRPMERNQGFSKNQALLTILLTWIFSLFNTLPWLFAFEVERLDGQVYCFEAWENEHLEKVYFLVANLTFCYFVPFLLICFSNLAIWRRVSRRDVPQDSELIRRIHRQTRRGVRKTLGIVTSAYLISWLPLYILATRLKFSSIESIGEFEGKLLSFLMPCAQLLGSFNSSMNPVFYAFFNSKFRQGVKALLCSLFCKDQNKNNLSREASQFQVRPSNATRRRNMVYFTETEFGTENSRIDFVSTTNKSQILTNDGLL